MRAPMISWLITLREMAQRSPGFPGVGWSGPLEVLR